ncbi:hypothetical protein BGZ60DRAFT_537230 [Tricladium varicosporioides]|nr:hypothetical protein BGZ60DRAFT_537230 [Hymenoscyphus varicosporioides]
MACSRRGLKPAPTNKRETVFECEVEGCGGLFGRVGEMQDHIDSFHGGSRLWCPFRGCEWKDEKKRRYLSRSHKIVKHCVQNITSLEVPDRWSCYHESVRILESNDGFQASPGTFLASPQINDRATTAAKDVNSEIDFYVTGVGQWLSNFQLESLTGMPMGGRQPDNTSGVSQVM